MVTFSKPAKLIGLIRTCRDWPRALVDHLGMNRREYQCRFRGGERFAVRGGSDDRHVLFEIFVGRVYPVEIPAGGTVLDIGANIGGFSVWAASRGAGRVVSLEPFPENFERLRTNLELNKLTNVEAVRAAVAGERGTRTLFLPDDPSHLGRFSLHPGRGGRTIDVPCLTLDDIVRDHRLDRIDVLKIDVQGSEYEILYGASPETLALVQRLVVECERFDEPADWSVAGLVRHLESVGFKTRTSGHLVYADRVAGTGRWSSTTTPSVVSEMSA